VLKKIAKALNAPRFSVIEVFMAAGVMFASHQHMYKFAVGWAVGSVALMAVLRFVEWKK
jgi:hypothetical protein